jgi:hypothetical protein
MALAEGPHLAKHGGEDVIPAGDPRYDVPAYEGGQKGVHAGE